MKVGVINYGVGNLGSVLRALDTLSVTSRLIDRPEDMRAVDALVLPGVGNFADCAQLLASGGWREAICEAVQVHARPLLGICVGMQLLASSSTEGAETSKSATIPGLNLIPGRVLHLESLEFHMLDGIRFSHPPLMRVFLMTFLLEQTFTLCIAIHLCQKKSQM